MFVKEHFSNQLLETLSRDINNKFVDLNFIHWYRAIVTGQLGTSDRKGTAQRAHMGPLGTNGHQWVQRGPMGALGIQPHGRPMDAHVAVHSEIRINTP